MKLIVGCTLWVVVVQSWAQVPAPVPPRTKPEVVAPLSVQPSDPPRLPGLGQAKDQKPAMSVSGPSAIKQAPLVPGNPASLGLCDGS